MSRPYQLMRKRNASSQIPCLKDQWVAWRSHATHMTPTTSHMLPTWYPPYDTHTRSHDIHHMIPTQNLDTHTRSHDTNTDHMTPTLVSCPGQSDSVEWYQQYHDVSSCALQWRPTGPNQGDQSGSWWCHHHLSVPGAEPNNCFSASSSVQLYPTGEKTC